MSKRLVVIDDQSEVRDLVRMILKTENYELFEAGKAEFDRDRRFAIYQQVQRLALDQAPVVYLSWRSQAYAMRKELQGFYNLPGALSFYSGDTLEGTSLG